ncbi:hypothetical protein TNCV_228771 [Trichonephila clavipes]|nr:hypothetical protein TNCV_228771 [Trichonephila clavipes]
MTGKIHCQKWDSTHAHTSGLRPERSALDRSAILTQVGFEPTPKPSGLRHERSAFDRLAIRKLEKTFPLIYFMRTKKITRLNIIARRGSWTPEHASVLRPDCSAFYRPLGHPDIEIVSLHLSYEN